MTRIMARSQNADRAVKAFRSQLTQVPARRGRKDNNEIVVESWVDDWIQRLFHQ